MSELELDDPSDFASPSLRTLDSSLRCQICHELFTAPVLLATCSHTFDSLCLRNHLTDVKKCPQCGLEANEDRIRRNLVLEDVVQSWRTVRAHLVSLEHSASTSSVPYPPPVPSTSSVSTRQSLKRKLAQPSPPTRRSAIKSDAVSEQQEITLIDDDDDHGEDDAASSDIEVIEAVNPAHQTSKRPKRESGSGSNTHSTPRGSHRIELNSKGKARADDDETGRDPKDPSILVRCPMCHNLVRNGSISPHIDSGCAKFIISTTTETTTDLGGPNSLSSSSTPTRRKKKQPENAFGRLMGMTMSSTVGSGASEQRSHGTSDDRDASNFDTTKYRALPNYAFKKLKEIESMLKDLDLPVAVPASHAKSQESKITYLKKRHSKYLTLWNANADISPKPLAEAGSGGGGGGRHKNAKELKDELRRWEKVLLDEGKVTSTSGGRTASRDAGRSRTHEVDFKHLINLARASHEKDKEKRARPKETTKDDSENALNVAESETEKAGPDPAEEGATLEDRARDKRSSNTHADGVMLSVETNEEETEVEPEQRFEDAQTPLSTLSIPDPAPTNIPLTNQFDVDRGSEPTVNCEASSTTNRRTVRIVTPPRLAFPSPSTSPSPTSRIPTPPVPRRGSREGNLDGVDPERTERSSSILEYDEKFFPPTSQRVREVDWDLIRRARKEEDDYREEDDEGE